MRFDRRIFADGDQAREHEPLPDDLERLAQRLRQDADLLARSYPPRELRQVVGSAVQSRFSRALGAAAAAVLIAATAWATLRLAGDDNQSRGPVSRGAVDPPLAVVDHNPVPSVTPDPVAEHRRFGIPLIDGSPRRLVPVMSFEDLTAPEQEAVLDLLEEHAQDAMKLSI